MNLKNASEILEHSVLFPVLPKNIKTDIFVFHCNLCKRVFCKKRVDLLATEICTVNVRCFSVGKTINIPELVNGVANTKAEIENSKTLHNMMGICSSL